MLLRKFNHAGLNPTDDLDNKPLELMQTARCGKGDDAAVQTSDGESYYVFLGDSYWKLGKTKSLGTFSLETEARPTRPSLLTMESPISLKERSFTDRSPSAGYPKDISNWLGLPSNLNTAFSWGHGQHLLFFKGGITPGY